MVSFCILSWITKPWKILFTQRWTYLVLNKKSEENCNACSSEWFGTVVQVPRRRDQTKWETKKQCWDYFLLTVFHKQVKCFAAWLPNLHICCQQQQAFVRQTQIKLHLGIRKETANHVWSLCCFVNTNFSVFYLLHDAVFEDRNPWYDFPFVEQVLFFFGLTREKRVILKVSFQIKQTFLLFCFSQLLTVPQPAHSQSFFHCYIPFPTLWSTKCNMINWDLTFFGSCGLVDKKNCWLIRLLIRSTMMWLLPNQLKDCR